jgi:hypothetical protein
MPDGFAFCGRASAEASAFSARDAPRRTANWPTTLILANQVVKEGQQRN